MVALPRPSAKFEPIVMPSEYSLPSHTSPGADLKPASRTSRCVKLSLLSCQYAL